MKQSKKTCDPCEQKFEKGIKEIVDKVEKYTETKHIAKKQELSEAFCKRDKEPVKD